MGMKRPAALPRPMVQRSRSEVSRLCRDGMLQDILGTPEAMRVALERHLGPRGLEGEGEEAPRVRLPTLEQQLPSGHRLAGRTALEVMSASSGGGAGYKKFHIIGGGSSYNAALMAEYLIETVCRIPVEVHYASEYRHRRPCLAEGDVLIVVSSSGETADAVESLRMVKKCTEDRGVLTLAVVNDGKSTLAQEADAVIPVDAGAEAGVASTKVFSCTVTAFVLLAIAIGEASDALHPKERKKLLAELEKLPDQVDLLLERESKVLQMDRKRNAAPGECVIWDIGCQNALANNFIFLGRGFNFPIALEGAMKLKELAYIHAEGYPAAEMKHGPIALIDQFMPVVVIAPRSDETYEKVKSNIEEVKARNGACIAITEDGNSELQDICEHVITVPPTHEFLMPLLTVAVLQLLAYAMGVVRGNDVNSPRGLKKSISSSSESSEN